MSYCVQCRRLCAEDALWCEICQPGAENDLHSENANFRDISSPNALPSIKQTWEMRGALTFPVQKMISPLAEEPGVSQGVPSSLSALHAASEQTVSRLHDAASQIEEEQASSKRLRRVSRLAPLHDISADIQRSNTPQRRARPHSPFDTQPIQEACLAQLTDPNATEYAAGTVKKAKVEEPDPWASTADPFLARARPTAAEAASIEAADIHLIQLEKHRKHLDPALPPARRRRSAWRLILAVALILALGALLVDGLLLSFIWRAVHHASPAQGGPPALLLSTSLASSGEQVSVRLQHFPPHTDVALTRDIQQPILPTTLPVNAAGQVTAAFTLGNTWSIGSHLIVAEDVATHDTANALLQVENAEPARPPHLLLASTMLDFGSAVQGANTLQALTLRNTGGGAITWSASSNQPWLLVAPLQGTFGTGQTIALAAQRVHLSPGRYSGIVTLSSNAGAPVSLHVTMDVAPLLAPAGPGISLAPPLLSFTATDGSATPLTQGVTLSNPGDQRLFWTLGGGQAVVTTPPDLFPPLAGERAHAFSTLSNFDLSGEGTPWLSSDTASGALAPGQSTQLRLSIHVQNLLPGTYMSLLALSTDHQSNAYDAPQLVAVSLTVQPHCGLLTSTGSLSFTAVTGQSATGTHTLTLTATSSCADAPLTWRAFPSPSWITVSPASGEIKGDTSSVTSIGVESANLSPGTYSGQVLLLAGKSTSLVTLQLTVQPRPAAWEPVLSVSPLSLNFSALRGQPDPVRQVFTITNNGGSVLQWHSLIAASNATWLSVFPGSGSLAPNSNSQVIVSVNAADLVPGDYSGQIILTANSVQHLPARGSPQSIAVNLLVRSPCVLVQPSTGALFFTSNINGPNPTAQNVTLLSLGNCAWPLRWFVSATPTVPWLTLTPVSGLLNSSLQEADIAVGINAGGLAAGSYSTHVSISASDANGSPIQGSQQTFTVTLLVQ